MEITYKKDVPLNINEVIDICISSGINRPTDDTERITKMYYHAKSGDYSLAWQ